MELILELYVWSRAYYGTDDKQPEFQVFERCSSIILGLADRGRSRQHIYYQILTTNNMDFAFGRKYPPGLVEEYTCIIKI